MGPILQAVCAALWAAALSTLGDWIWARFIPAHRPVYGLIHGTALCLGIGLALGVFRDRAPKGALAGAAIGFGAAGGFYVLARFMGYAAMFVLWMALWVAFSLLVARGLGEPREPMARGWIRGALAAVGSGLAFYAISGIWTRHKDGGPDYPYNFACWTIAFLPGFMALLLRGTRVRPSPAESA
ncbi:MAG TPA: hypothetical protein VFQ51_17980 [Vicinamibacteria bacterium]|nr:hypothetical protein [Vicinamibacteria bacterium]